MIKQVYKINDWTINILLSVNAYDISEVLDELESIDCPVPLLKKAEILLESDDKNKGFTYSNMLLNESVIAIGEVTSIGEMINTIAHECYHLMEHLKITDLYTDEQCATTMGDFIQEIFNNIVDIFNEL